jgi:hypothetical protein
VHAVRFTLTAGAALAVALMARPALAQATPASAPLERAHDPDQLRPGEWVWAPEVSPNGPVVIYVDLNRQLVSVYRNGVRIGVSTASTGRRGYETPTGAFTVLQKNARHRSNLYDNAPMPYMLRLTWDGVALHGGAVRDRPVSHGCVRLPLAFARELFSVAPMGGTVVVVGEAAADAAGPGAGVLAPVLVGGAVAAYEALRAGQAYTWRPEASLVGPVTVIMSVTDQQVVVLRNGVEIGRARASIPGDVGDARLLMVADHVEDAPRWMEVAPSGGDANAAAAPAAPLDRVRMPLQFEDAMQRVLTPGTTMLITHAPVADERASADVADIGGAPISVFDMER